MTSESSPNSTKHTALASSTSSTSSHKSTYSTTLESTTPASASPFPSPSSSFLPPPTPGAHEFAVKPPPHLARKASANAHMIATGGGANGTKAVVNGHAKERSGGSAATTTDDIAITPIATHAAGTPLTNGTAGPGEASLANPTLLSPSLPPPSTSTTTTATPQSHIAQQQQVYATSQNALTPREDVIVVGALGAPSSSQTAPVVSPRTSSLRASTTTLTPPSSATVGGPATPSTPTVASAARLSGSNATEWNNSPTTPTPSKLAFTMKGSRAVEGVSEKEKEKGTGSSEVTPSPSMFIPPRSSSLASSSTTTNSTTINTSSTNPPVPGTPTTKRQSLLILEAKTPTKASSSPSADGSSSPLLSSRPAPPSPALSATNIAWGSPSTSSSGPRRISRTFSSSSQRNSAELAALSSSSPLDRSERDGMNTLSRAGSKREKRFSQLSSSFTLPPPLSVLSPEDDIEDFKGVGGKVDGYEGLGPPPVSAASTASTVTVTPTPASPALGPASLPPPAPSALPAKDAQTTPSKGPPPREREKERKTPRTTYTVIRDFAFGESDVRFCGMGEDVPKSNRVERINRALRGGWVRARKRLLEAHRLSTSSISSTYSTYSTYSNASNTSSTNSDEEEEGDESGGGFGGWEGFQMRFGRMSWSAGFGASSSSSAPSSSNTNNNTNGYPSHTDLSRNFQNGFADEDEDYDLVGDEELEDDDVDDFDDDLEDEGGRGGGDEEELYPGIYRAMFAFDPEGTAEVALAEDQLVRVVGRGGGVGWAVVQVDWKPTPALVKELREMGADLGSSFEDPSAISGVASTAIGCGGVDVDTKDGGKVRHGLVPESYLTPVKLDLVEV